MILWCVVKVAPDVSEDTVAYIFKPFMNAYPVLQFHIPEDPAKAEKQ